MKLSLSEEIADSIPTCDGARQMLFFTSNRVIVAKTRGKWSAFLHSTDPLGFLHDLDEAMKKEKLKKMSPESILKADKDNFAIPYDGLVRVEIRNRGWRLDSIKIIAEQKFGKIMKKKRDKRTQKDVYVYEKFFWEKEHFKDYVNVVRSVLPDKVVVL